jgi:hypothetical protein
VFSKILGPLLTIGIVSSSFAQQVTVPFDACVHSDDWNRPSADVQSKIWSDARYKELGAGAYEWTHTFLWNEPDSASITYHKKNLSGLWAEIAHSQCPRRDGERDAWTEIWALNNRVTGISLSGLIYTISVVSQERGYEIIQFHRPDSLGAAKATLRFVNDDGRIPAPAESRCVIELDMVWRVTPRANPTAVVFRGVVKSVTRLAGGEVASVDVDTVWRGRVPRQLTLYNVTGGSANAEGEELLASTAQRLLYMPVPVAENRSVAVL